VGQLGRRQAVLFSLIVHLMIVSFLANKTRTELPKPKPQASVTRRSPLVYVPPAVPRARATPPPAAPVLPRDVDRTIEFHRPKTAPTPMPTPPPRMPSDRMSIGTAQGPLQREFSPDKTTSGGLESRPGTPGQKLPPPPESVGPEASATEEQRAARPIRPGGAGERPVLPEDRSLLGSARRQERRLADLGDIGEGGATRQMGPLRFDPHGADFTAWINHYRTEVYRNWIVPQAAMFGFAGGDVEFEFVVERDGSISSIRKVGTTGLGSYDRAAENALRGARLLPLPGDFTPLRVQMAAGFTYTILRRRPQGS
jgi:outer membrane biosynthesis protein TonB